MPRLRVIESPDWLEEETPSKDQSSTEVELKVESMGESKGVSGLPPIGTEPLTKTPLRILEVEQVVGCDGRANEEMRVISPSKPSNSFILTFCNSALKMISRILFAIVRLRIGEFIILLCCGDASLALFHP